MLHGFSGFKGVHWGRLRDAMDSLRPETDPAILGVQPARIRLERVSEPMSLPTFQERFPSSVPLRELAILNGLEPTDTIPAGRQMKRIIGGELPDWSGS